jgi:hypothetical protein
MHCSLCIFSKLFCFLHYFVNYTNFLQSRTAIRRICRIVFFVLADEGRSRGTLQHPRPFGAPLPKQFNSASPSVLVSLKPASISHIPRNPRWWQHSLVLGVCLVSFFLASTKSMHLIKNKNDDKMSREARAEPLTTCSCAVQLNPIASHKKGCVWRSDSIIVEGWLAVTDIDRRT